MDRKQILHAAEACITQDRAAIYGPPEDSFHRIADLWNAFLHARGKLAVMQELSPWDVAMMMALMKIARASGNPGHQDSYVDGAGYLALAGEMANDRA